MDRKNRLFIDPHNFKVKRMRIDWKGSIKVLLGFIAVTFSIFVVLCAVTDFLFSTTAERRLRRENRMYTKVLGTMEGRQKNLEEVIAALQYKDNAIYEQVFKSNAPNVDPMGSLDSFFASDTIPSMQLEKYTTDKADVLMAKSARIEENFRKIAEALVEPSRPLPPMLLPVGDISYAQVGASTGDRQNPFLKAKVRHGGIDLIMPPGSEVYAPADGEVTFSKALTGNMGTVVKLRHEGGYETVFAHLGTRFVKDGEKVRAGQKIGTVGMTGNAYAPHLHYEVYLNGVMEDPINHFFASVSEEEYANMFYMSSSTMQSMD